MRKICRVFIPLLLLAAAALCVYSATYFAWAHTASPDTHNAYYKSMCIIYFNLFIACLVLAGAFVYYLRPKRSSDDTLE